MAPPAGRPRRVSGPQAYTRVPAEVDPYHYRLPPRRRSHHGRRHTKCSDDARAAAARPGVPREPRGRRAQGPGRPPAPPQLRHHRRGHDRRARRRRRLEVPPRRGPGAGRQERHHPARQRDLRRHRPRRLLPDRAQRHGPGARALRRLLHRVRELTPAPTTTMHRALLHSVPTDSVTAQFRSPRCGHRTTPPSRAWCGWGAAAASCPTATSPPARG